MKRSPFFWPSLALLIGIAGYTGAAVIPAIIPQAVPTANKRGNGTVFALASSNTAGTAGQVACDDGSGNLTYTGCTLNSVSSTSPVTVNTNTTMDQQLMELSLSAGYLNSAGRNFDFFGAGVYTTQTGQTPTLTFKIKLCTVSGCGSGTVITLISVTTGATTGASANISWNVRAVGVTATAGATGNLEIHGPAQVDLGSALSTAATVYNDTNTAVSSNIDLTAALFADFTVAFSTNAATANTCTQREGVISPGGSTSGGGGGGGTTITSSTFGSVGACSSTAFFKILTNSIYNYAFCDGSSNLSYYFQGQKMSLPVTTGWAWVNQGGATIDTSTNGFWVLTAPTSASASARIWAKSLPAAPYTITTLVNIQNIGNNFQRPGIVLYSSSTTNLVSYDLIGISGTTHLREEYWSNVTTPTGTVPLDITPWFALQPAIWLRVNDDGTNRIFSFSKDGVTFTQLISESDTANLTPNQFGIMADDETNTATATISLLSITGI